MRKSKTPAYSTCIKSEIVCANDTNPMGYLQGGRLLQWMDIAAAVTAQQHAGNICVTASINGVEFISSARIGDIIRIVARITRSFNSSMEIKVEAGATNVQSQKSYRICEAFFTFVALDDHGKATAVSPITPVTAEEKRLYRAALTRRKLKLKK